MDGGVKKGKVKEEKKLRNQIKTYILCSIGRGGGGGWSGGITLILVLNMWFGLVGGPWLYVNF